VSHPIIREREGKQSTEEAEKKKRYGSISTVLTSSLLFLLFSVWFCPMWMPKK
jgi:hypothetical protein